MAISARALAGGAAAVEMGELVWLPTKNGDKLAIGDMVFAKTGSTVVSDPVYQDALNLFGDQKNILEKLLYVSPATVGTVGYYCVIHDGNRFVAFGSKIATSLDGITWTVLNGASIPASTGNVGFISAAYNAGTWIARLYNSNTIYRSTDLLTWTPITLPTGTGSVTCIKYQNGLWIAGGMGGKIATSPDTVTWTLQATVAEFSNTALYDIAYWNGLWYAVGQGNYAPTPKTCHIAVSPDLVTWTSLNVGLDGVDAGNITLYGTAYGNGAFLAGGIRSYSGSPSNVLLRTTDGTNWTVIPNGPPYISGVSSSNSPIQGGLFFANGYFVATGSSGAIYKSRDGISWATSYSNGSVPSWTAFGAGVWVRTDTSGSYGIAYFPTSTVIDTPAAETLGASTRYIRIK